MEFFIKHIYCLLAVHYFPKEVPSPLFDKVLNTFVNKLRSGNFIANLEHYQHIGLIVLLLTFNMW